MKILSKFTLYFLIIISPRITLAQIDLEEKIYPLFQVTEKPNFIQCTDVTEDPETEHWIEDKTKCFQKELNNEFQRFEVPKELLIKDSDGDYKDFSCRIFYSYIIDKEGYIYPDTTTAHIRMRYFVKSCSNEEYNPLIKKELLRVLKTFPTLVPGVYQSKKVSTQLMGIFQLDINYGGAIIRTK